MTNLILLFQMAATTPTPKSGGDSGSFDILTFIAGFIAGVVATLVYVNFRQKNSHSESLDAVSIASAIPRPQKRKLLTKQCPKCKTEYTDQSLNFCLTDGTTLLSDGGEEFETIVKKM